MSKLYDRNFLFAALCQLFVCTATNMINHYARFITHLGGNEIDVGWIMGIGPIAGFAMRPWIGPWVDRIGSRKSQMVGCLLIFVGILGNVLFSELTLWLYFLRAILIVGGAIYFGASTTYATQIAPDDRRTEAIGILGCGGFVGMALGPVLGDWLLGAEETRTTGSFYQLFALSTLSVAIAMLLIFFIRPIPPFEQRSKGKIREFLSALRTYWPGSVLLVAATIGIFFTVVLYFLSDFLDSIHGGTLGEFFTIYCAWAIFLRFATRRLPDQMGRRKVLTAGIFFLSVGLFSLALVDAEHLSMLMIAAFLCGTGHALSYHTMFAVTTEQFPKHLQGTSAAVVLTFLDLGTILSSPIVGYIAKDFGYKSVFVGSGAFCLCVTIYFAATSLSQHRRRNEAKDIVTPLG